MRVAFDLRDLPAQQLGMPHRFGIVIRHVDHSRHAAGGCGSRRPAETFLIGLAPGMHLAVNDAGHHPLASRIE